MMIVLLKNTQRASAFLLLCEGNRSKPLNDLHDHSKQDTEQYHCRDRKIKSKVLFLNTDVAGKAADPVELVAKEINDHTNEHNRDTYYNYVFSQLWRHTAKIPLQPLL